MKIIDIRATPVTVPLAAPLRHANGSHWGRFVRTIVEVDTDEGIVGLGEMGGGGESAVAAFNGLKPYLLGRDPAHLEEMRFLIANPPRRSTTTAHRCSRRSSSRVSTSSARSGACLSATSSAGASAS